MINKFSSEVIEEIDCYVYRLVDSRNNKTFYVGKGRDNRVFDHINEELTFKGDEDEISEKIAIIRDIRQEGLDVIHIIHKHGLNDKTAFFVSLSCLIG